MYEAGGDEGYDTSTDTTDASGSEGTIDVNVDGQDYQETANTEVDGHAAYEVDDGSGDEVAYVDTNDDGTADTAVAVDSSGDYAEATDSAEDGNWQVEETGTVDSSGNVHPDSTSTSS